MALKMKKITAYIILFSIILYANFLFIKSITPNYSLYTSFFIDLFIDFICGIIFIFALSIICIGFVSEIKKCRANFNYKKLLSCVTSAVIGGFFLWVLVSDISSFTSKILDLPRAINRNPIVDNEIVKDKYSWIKVTHSKSGTRRIPMTTVVTDKNTFTFQHRNDSETLLKKNQKVTIYYLPHTKRVLNITKIKEETW
ncbi:hypothetical protein [Clostridium sp. JS66]|uniref:hypothetical protein n=1 Tax=Clostridium sp. JS66 TaxID=3064705 RepID=UPI00298D708B|nr:hypothetical protein [Clostridium sp. JS66]WPC39753.1 hypothetical protein Q6H37_17745 [Clostridium sp. JS66]